jgi:hypothetical protein
MELSVPSYYIVSRTLDGDQAACVIGALNITPVSCAVISDILDVGLAFKLSSEVIRTNTPADALELAKKIAAQHGRPPIVIGEADLLDAVFADGKKVNVACSS